MKKLLACTTLTALAITGCATSPANTQTTSANTTADNTQQKRLIATYQCDDNASVIANYQPQSDRAVLSINVPSWKLLNQEITMNSAVSGSGMRFVNHTNPNSLYEWHAKGRDAILAVTIAGTEHTLACRGVGQSLS